MAVDDPLYWWTAVDNKGGEWPVYLATVEGEDSLVNCHGVTYGLKEFMGKRDERKAIYINAWYSVKEQNKTLLHELLHVAYDGGILSEVAEEEFVSRVESPLWAMLRKHGGLRWPRRPRGYAELARKARRLR